MTGPRTPCVAADGSDVRSLGERYGWLLGAIWIVFLIYPLTAVADADLARRTKVAAIIGIVAFGALYVTALSRVGRSRQHGDRWPAAVFVALLVLAGSLTPVLEVSVLGLVPYLVSFAMMGLPRGFAIGVLVVGLSATILGPAALGVLEDWWFVAIIVLLTGFTTLFIRIMEEREEEGEMVRGQLAVVAERERVARDVHDLLGHSLTVVTVKAELAERILDVDLERARSELRQIQSLTRQALGEVRATVGGLRVARLGDELDQSRQALAAAGIEADLPPDVDIVDPRYRIIFAWVLREAVTNVVRHSRARRCVVALAPNQMLVDDDGVGLGERVGGNGLRGVRERVEAASGTLELSSDPSTGGTSLRVVM